VAGISEPASGAKARARCKAFQRSRNDPDANPVAAGATRSDAGRRTGALIAPAQPAHSPPIGSADLVTLPLVGLARRLMSVAYEALLLAAILFIANFLLLPIVSPLERGSQVPSIPDPATRALLFCVLFAIAAAYFVWSWTGGRRTLPMKTWRMRLVDSHGAPLAYKAAFVRFLAAWIGPGLALLIYPLLRPEGLAAVALVMLPLNYFAALFDPDKQFLHDRIAGTRIVQQS